MTLLDNQDISNLINPTPSRKRKEIGKILITEKWISIISKCKEVYGNKQKPKWCIWKDEKNKKYCLRTLDAYNLVNQIPTKFYECIEDNFEFGENGYIERVKMAKKIIKFDDVNMLCNELMTTYYFDNFNVSNEYETDDIPTRIREIGNSKTIDEFIYYTKNFNATLKRRKSDYEIRI